VFIRATVTFNT